MISGRTKIAGVMGWPVDHSRSPRIHGYWLNKYVIDGVYIPLAVEPTRLEQALRALPALGFRGCNLTIPHKEAALTIMDVVDPLAQRVGAINTAVVTHDNKLEGRNTDVFGFQENLKAAGFSFGGKQKTAVILGAGGAARAVVVALQEMGFQEIRLVNRSRERAETCAACLMNGGTLTAVDWRDRAKALAGAGLLVNTTSLGMVRQPELDLDLSMLPPAAWVTDVVYTPLMTSLLHQAQQRGHRIVDGLGMLLHQARPGFTAWFGVEPEVTGDLRRFVVADA